MVRALRDGKVSIIAKDEDQRERIREELHKFGG